MVPFSILFSSRTGQLLLASFLLLVACRPLDGPRASFAGPVPEEAITRLGKGTIRELAFMPDGRFLAAATDAGLIQYDSRNLDESWQLATNAAALRAAYSADGHSLLAGLADGSLLLLDAQSGQIREQWPSYNSDVGVRALAWQPQGSDRSALAVAGFDDGNILLLFVGPDRVEILGGLPRQQNGITALSFAPDGRFLATGNRAGSIYLIDVGEQRLFAELSEHDPGDAVTTLAWSPDGARLTSGDERGVIIEWDLPRMAPLQSLVAEEGAILTVSYLQDGAQVASAAADGALARWEPGQRANATRENLGAPQTTVAWDSRGGRYATGGRDGTLSLWALPDDGSWPQEPDLTLIGHAPFAHQVAAVAYEPQGERLLTNLGPLAVIWDAVDARRLATFAGHEANISAAAWSPDGRLAATADRGGLVTIWQTEDGTLVRTLEEHAQPVTGLAWSPDGRRLASAGSLAGEVLVWDTETGTVLHNLSGEGDGLWSVGWSPDGALLAAGSTGGKIFFWDTADFDAPPFELQRHLAWVSDLVWHADGARLLSGSGDSMVILWDVPQRNSALFPGHEQPVRGVAFSPENALAASGGMEGALILWDTDPTALEGVVSILRGHAGGVTAVDWSADGRFVASGSEDGTVLIWPTPARR